VCNPKFTEDIREEIPGPPNKEDGIGTGVAQPWVYTIPKCSMRIFASQRIDPSSDDIFAGKVNPDNATDYSRMALEYGEDVPVIVAVPGHK